jgi:predicted aspartyl protease
MGRCQAIMKTLIIDEGLLLSDMEVVYQDKSLLLKRVLIDTGSGGTILSSDLVEKIGLIGEEGDTIYRISGVWAIIDLDSLLLS